MAGRESEGNRLCLMHLLPHWVVVSNVSYELDAWVAVHFLCGHTEKNKKHVHRADAKKKMQILYYTMVCLNTRLWLAVRYALKPFNAQVVPSQFNHRSILMWCFNWCTQSHTHHSHTQTHTHTHTHREGERESEITLSAHTHTNQFLKQHSFSICRETRRRR